MPRSKAELDRWLREHPDGVYGFDVEWRPNRHRGQRNPVSVVQLATATHACVVQAPLIRHLGGVLSDPAVLKAGVGILEDARKLQRDHGVALRGAVDVGVAAARQAGASQPVGLKRLCKELLGVELAKPRRVVMSDWQAAKLTPAQVRYAALDAIYGRRAYAKLEPILRDDLRSAALAGALEGWTRTGVSAAAFLASETEAAAAEFLGAVAARAGVEVTEEGQMAITEGHVSAWGRKLGRRHSRLTGQM